MVSVQCKLILREVIQLPYSFVKERFFTRYELKTPFVQIATPFQDFVIRCVRYAFAFIPAKIGKVFFSKDVALPFLRFRMLRHGYLRSPFHWAEVNRNGLKGIYMIYDETRRPDVMVYYAHGGGFSMGSSYFYMEFLLSWVSLLKDAGYSNPALFALEYTLVPEATYPTQILEALKGYEYVLSTAQDSSQIVVGGDSAGATLMLSLQLHMSADARFKDKLPGLAVLISPWAAIISPKNRDTPSDYLNADSLHLYGSQYVGTKASAEDALVSPARCRDLDWWRRASPSQGWSFIYGAEEVFGPETKEMIDILRKAGTHVEVHEEPHWVHAWPVVKLFLCDGSEARTSGLRSIVKTIVARVQHDKKA